MLCLHFLHRARRCSFLSNLVGSDKSVVQKHLGAALNATGNPKP